MGSWVTYKHFHANEVGHASLVAHALARLFESMHLRAQMVRPTGAFLLLGTCGVHRFVFDGVSPQVTGIFRQNERFFSRKGSGRWRKRSGGGGNNRRGAAESGPPWLAAIDVSAGSPFVCCRFRAFFKRRKEPGRSKCSFEVV